MLTRGPWWPGLAEQVLAQHSSEMALPLQLMGAADSVGPMALCTTHGEELEAVATCRMKLGQ